MTTCCLLHACCSKNAVWRLDTKRRHWRDGGSESSFSVCFLLVNFRSFFVFLPTNQTCAPFLICRQALWSLFSVLPLPYKFVQILCLIFDSRLDDNKTCTNYYKYNKLLGENPFGKHKISYFILSSPYKIFFID